MEGFEKGDKVILLDRPLGHPTRTAGVIVGIISEDTFNILLTNGYGKGNIKRVKSFHIAKEQDVILQQREKREIS